MAGEKKETRPAQKQRQQPGREREIHPRPKIVKPRYRGSGKLRNKTALITGGDSGIGRSVSVYFAKEGADIVIVYLNEHKDAQETKAMVEREGRRCLTIPGDVGDESFCRNCIQKTISTFGHLDILVNNAGEQHEKNNLEEITTEQLERTFRTNIFSFFYMTKAALKELGPGSAIINSASVTAYRGKKTLIDYSSTKGAIVSFTRSLALNLAEKEIRVNAVAPGPIWTPLIPATFEPEHVQQFGAETPMKRPGEPEEVAPCYVFLASSDSSYMTGQVLHPNGGEPVSG